MIIEGPGVLVSTELVVPVLEALRPLVERATAARAPLARPLAALVGELAQVALAGPTSNLTSACGLSDVDPLDGDSATAQRDRNANVLTLAEVAPRLGISQRQARRRAVEGKVPGARKLDNGRWIVDAASFLAMFGAGAREIDGHSAPR